MPFVSSTKLPKIELFPGAMSGIIAGEQIMFSFLEMEEGSQVPAHSHPHEQAGLVLEGKLQFKIGTEEKIMGPGDAVIVPANMVHSGTVLKGPAKVLDAFSPLREDYLESYNEYTQTSGSTIWD